MLWLCYNLKKKGEIGVPKITVLSEDKLSRVSGGSWSMGQVAVAFAPCALVGGAIIAVSVVGNRLYKEYISRKKFEKDLIKKLDDLSKQVDKLESKK